MTDRDVMQQALEALEADNSKLWPSDKRSIAIEALRARLAEPEPEPEPVALKWSPAPRKTEWGFGMVCADVEIDRDHTLTLYCEEDQTAKVDAMLSPTRSPLTDEEILKAVGWETAEMYFKLTPGFPVAEARAETLKNARAIERAHGIGGNDD